jgi:rod shape-determining protein MreD
VKTVAVLVAIIAGLALQMTLSGMMIGGRIPVNLVLVAVVYIGLAFGPVTGMLAGACAGLAQDSLAGTIVGIGGLSKTLVGFLVGVLGAQFIVSQMIPRFVMFVGATLLHEIVFEALYALVEGRPFALHMSGAFVQALVNAVLGVIAFYIVEQGPGILQRREARRASFSRRRY